LTGVTTAIYARNHPDSTKIDPPYVIFCPNSLYCQTKYSFHLALEKLLWNNSR
jgi:hypothetical protein